MSLSLSADSVASLSSAATSPRCPLSPGTEGGAGSEGSQAGVSVSKSMRFPTGTSRGASMAVPGDVALLGTLAPRPSAPHWGVGAMAGRTLAKAGSTSWRGTGHHRTSGRHGRTGVRAGPQETATSMELGQGQHPRCPQDVRQQCRDSQSWLLSSSHVNQQSPGHPCALGTARQGFPSFSPEKGQAEPQLHMAHLGCDI